MGDARILAALLSLAAFQPALAQYPDPNEEIQRQETPAPPPAAAPAGGVALTCADGAQFTLVVGPRGQHATLLSKDGQPVALIARPAASGVWFEGGGWDVRGKGADYVVTGPDGAARNCAAR